MSEREKKELAIRRHMEAERRNQYSLTTTTTTNGNNVWKTAIVVVGLGLLVGIFGGVAYLIGQNSVKSKYKC